MSFIQLNNIWKDRASRRVIIIDLFMLVLVVLNLAFILFDWSFSIQAFQNIIKFLSYDFFVWYRDVIHPDFYVYDLFFVAIFVAEILIRWALAIKRKEYYRWWFYPIVHWYDVLGCLPLSTFRFLRLFRIFSLLYRLQRMGAVDWTDTFVYSKYIEYREIVTEEVTDRVVIKILRGLQEEMYQDGPLSERLVEEVLEPRKEIVVRFLSHKLAESTGHLYEENKVRLSIYIESVVSEAIDSSEDLQRLKKVPLVGPEVISGLQNGISDSLLGGIDRLARDLSGSEYNPVIDAAAESTLWSLQQKHPDDEVESLFKDMVSDALDLIIAQVEVKQWQVRAEEEKKQRSQS